MTRFISICSGIEAASVAFAPLGWKASAFAEIEPFPNAVLAHHYPDVPNLGDMTQFRSWPHQLFLDSDLIVGGPPCQAFSVAGQRKGLQDHRGNITLIYVELINHADQIREAHGLPPVVVVYENVPGLLSDKQNAFGSFLGALSGEDETLVPSGKKWTNAGVVLGPERTIAWRTLDAQYFGLAQRRKRIFLISSAREGFNPAEVLFEFEGLRRDTAPSRETGQEAAGNPAQGACHHGGAAALATPNRMVAFGEYKDDNTASAIKARDYKDATDLIAYETVGALDQECGAASLNHQSCIAGHLIPHAYSVREDAAANNFSATPLEVANAIQAHQPSVQSHHAQVFIAQAIPIHDSATRYNGKRGDKQDGKANGLGIGAEGDPMNTLTKGDRHAVAYTQPIVLMDQGGSVMSVLDDGTVGTLRRETHGHEPLVMQEQTRTYSTPAIGCVKEDEVSSAITRNTGGGGETQNPAYIMQPLAFSGQMSEVQVDKDMTSTLGAKNPMAVATGMAVRRLTPQECEALQGFPRDYTNIPWRGKPESPDGPRYKALGNSWAVPVARWVGQRIDQHLKGISS